MDPTTGDRLSVRTVLHSLASSSSTTTTTHLLHTLQAFPFPAAFWEFPPLSSSILANEDVPFEFVLVKAPALASPSFKADPQPFAEYLEKSGEEDVCVFANLGRDATLVVPTCRVEKACGDGDDEGGDSSKKEETSVSMNEYAHLLSFLRGTHVPEAQKLRLLQRVAQVTLEKCHENEQQEDKLVWLSTSGLGVSWLHVRVEDQPKYYQHLNYVRRGGGRSGGNEAPRKSGKRY